MKTLLASILIFIVITGFSQPSEDISFNTTSHSFGSIKEADGPVVYEFTFKNNSTETFQITNVKASCGCTTPDWSKKSVLPGDSGFVQAQYNPRNRPGRFNKSLTVSHNLGDPIRLYINGNVEPRPRSLEESYPAELGPLRMKTSSLSVGRIFVNREPAVRKFEIVNQSDQPVIFSDVKKSPAHIDLSFETDTLLAKSITNLIVSYDGAKKDDLGFMNEKVSFYIEGDSSQVENELNIYASLQEYYAPLPPDKLALAPKLMFDEAIYDMGRIKAGSEAELDIELRNEGQSDLVIKKLYPNCSCIETSMKKTKLKPNSTQNLKVKFNASGRRGNQQKSITIYSNDPLGSVKRITLRAYIEE